MSKILIFISTNYKTILQLGFGIFVVYWMIFFLTPKIEMSEVDRYKIQQIDEFVKKTYENQLKLDSSIKEFNEEIEVVEMNIKRIKGEKTVIREIYHEEINRVNEYSDKQLDSFFTNRYGITPR